MIRLFISQPMNGKTYKEIQEEKKRAIERIKRKMKTDDIEVIDTYIKENPPKETKNNGAWYLGKSLVMLSTADIAYFIGKWDRYKGCRIEHECAKEYGIEIVEE